MMGKMMMMMGSYAEDTSGQRDKGENGKATMMQSSKTDARKLAMIGA